MNPLPLILGLIAVFVTVGALLWYFSVEQRLKRRLRDMPRQPIRRLQDGQRAKVVGHVETVEAPLIAPLTGRACVGWQVEVDVLKNRGKSTRWVKLIRDHDYQVFRIRDASGEALVNDTSPHLLLVKDANLRSMMFTDASPEMERFLAKYGQTSVGFLGFNRTLRYREGVLEPGERAAVLGRITMRPDAQGHHGATNYREAPMLAVIGPSTEGTERVIISDMPETMG